jgi:hypothetical protein
MTANVDCSDWHWGIDADGFIKGVCEDAAKLVVSEVADSMSVSISPSFDLDGDERAIEGLFIEASSLDFSITWRAPLVDAAMDACCGDQKRAQYIAKHLRMVADMLDAATF